MHEIFVFEGADVPNNSLAGYVETLGKLSRSESFVVYL